MTENVGHRDLALIFGITMLVVAADAPPIVPIFFAVLAVIYYVVAPPANDSSADDYQKFLDEREAEISRERKSRK